MSGLSSSPLSEISHLSPRTLGQAWDDYIIVSIRDPRRNRSYRAQWWVASESSKRKFYKVSLSSDGMGWQCECWAFRKKRDCKHIASIKVRPSLAEWNDLRNEWAPMLPLGDVFRVGGGASSVLHTPVIPSVLGLAEIKKGLLRQLTTLGLTDEQMAFLILAHYCVGSAQGEGTRTTTGASDALSKKLKIALEELNTAFGDGAVVGAKPGVLQTIELLEELRKDVPDLDNTIENALFWLRQIL